MSGERSRYEYPLTELCDRIHGAYTGSGMDIPSVEAEELYAWLTWRLTDGWEPLNLRWPAYEGALFALCLQARIELMHYIVWGTAAFDSQSSELTRQPRTDG